MAIFKKISKSGKLYLHGRKNNPIKYKQLTDDISVVDLSSKVNQFAFVKGTEEERDAFEKAKKQYIGFGNPEDEGIDVVQPDQETEEENESQEEQAEVEENEEKENEGTLSEKFACVHTKGGWYDVINIQTDEVMNVGKKMRVAEAKKFAEELNGQ